MNKNKIVVKNKILVLSSFLILLSCVSEFNPDLPAKETDVLIVGGSIVGNTTCTIYLGRNLSVTTGTDRENHYVEEGIVTLIDGKGNESSPAVNAGKGAYQLQVGELDENTLYGVKIIYNGNTYQSELSLPLLTPPIDSISFQQPVRYGPVDFCVSNHNPSEEIGYYRWQYEEDWEQIVSYYTILDYDTAKGGYYELDTIAVPYRCMHKTRSNPQTVSSTAKLRENVIINQPIFNVDPAIRFRELYCITVTQQILSRRGYEYFQNKRELNEDLGGLFSPQPSMIEGNISCLTDPEKRAIGYIEVNKNLTSKKLFVTPGEISSRYGAQSCEEILSIGDVNSLLGEQQITMTDYYKMGYRPYLDKEYRWNLERYLQNPGDLNRILMWGDGECLDCRLSGGVMEKPEWWPARPGDE